MKHGVETVFSNVDADFSFYNFLLPPIARKFAQQ